ncbi:restriction endonuclease subunit S [bacterium]|nr:restriction endonuclease subunit S [bacterium]
MKTSEVRINDIAQIITGKTPPTVIKEYFGNKYPFITPSDIPTFRERRLRGMERYLSDKGFSHQKKMLIPPNSPCFVAIGSTVGKMCLTNEDSFTNQQIHSLITQKGKADPFYLFYHLRYIYPWIKSIADARGSGKAIINKTDFGKIKINLPPLPIQKKIAAILSTNDDLIENNNRRIAILEKMAEEIYREWFVRMRFPGHEKVKFHKGVPEGWAVEKIKDIVNRKKFGRIYREKELNDHGKIPVIDQSVKECLGFYDGKPEHKASIENPIILFGDYTCKMQLMIEPFSLAENVIPFRVKGDMPISFLFYLIKNLVA